MSEPFYHLRPNKYVDRQLFTKTLSSLASLYNISEYHYVGFGSYLFDDFKLLHHQLNIKKMISLEANPQTYMRANYNLPYNCITVINTTSTDFITNFEAQNDNYIFWLDYTNPKDLGQQFSDIATLLDKANTYDIIKVTLNANSASLSPNNCHGNALHAKRLEELKFRLGENIVPCNIDLDDMNAENYPVTLLKCLKRLIENTLTPSEYDMRYFLPILSTIYQDGQKMVTLTGIIIDSVEEEKKIRENLGKLEFISLSWEKIAKINIPNLSIKEIIEINKLLPNDDALELIRNQFPFIFHSEGQDESYITYYKYYPNFHHFNL